MRDEALRKQNFNTKSSGSCTVDAHAIKGNSEEMVTKPKKKQVTLDKIYSITLKDKEREQKEEKEAKPATSNQMLHKILSMTQALIIAVYIANRLLQRIHKTNVFLCDQK